MILYGSVASPYVRHCRIALDQSGLEWQFKVTDFGASAKGSPGQRVPYLSDGDTLLTDSSSILMYVREKSNRPFISSVSEMELFTMASTAADATINLFLLEAEGLTPATTPYLARQQSRVVTLLEALNQQQLNPELNPEKSSKELNDAELRLACFLDWALYRERIEISKLDNLQAFLAHARTSDGFAQTSPEIAAS